MTHGYRGGPRWADPTYCEWSVVVGDRVRRLRRERGWSLGDLAAQIEKPQGTHYSPGFFSRLERGWASAPLHVYLAVAHALGIEPGRLLGVDDWQRDLNEAEVTLVRYVRAAGLEPHEAIARIARARGDGE